MGSAKGSSKKGKGKPENDLSNEDAAYNAIFGGNFGSMEIGSFIGSAEDDGRTQHLPNAVDFEDEDELADEELPEEEPAPAQNSMDNSGSTSKGDGGVDEMNSNLMGAAFGNDLPNGVGFVDPLQHGGHQIMDNGMSGEDFHAGNNALFMEMDQTNMLFSNPQADFGDFSKDGVAMGPNLGNAFDSQALPLEYGGTDGLLDTTDIAEQQRLKEEQRQRELVRKQEKVKRDKLLLKYYFPDFKKGKVMKWNKAIYRKTLPYPWHHELLASRPKNTLFPFKVKLHVQADQRRLFKMDANSSDNIKTSSKQKVRRTRGIVQVSLDELYPAEVKELATIENTHQEISEDLLIATDDWDEERMINGASSDEDNALRSIANDAKKIVSKLQDDKTEWEWNEDDLIDAKLKTAKNAELDMNDERLLLLVDDSKRTADKKKPNENETKLTEKSILKKFNISNDEAYEILRKSHQPRIRATISNLNIEHSQPALRLQSPFYKVNPTRSMMRFYHKPRFGQHLRPGMVITFSKLKIRKRKRDKGKDIKESFASSSDLTVGDTAPVYLMEYSEETPMALSRFGMANKLINYYRKVHENDTLRPKLPVGETHVLGVQDKSPFWNFGFVEPGQIVPTLYNNMIRAPVFKHDVSGTDFLLVRSTGNGISNRFFLRNINHIFTVGQTLPVEEIPGPNSRKVTSMKAQRLRMIVYRILNKTPSKSITIEPITRHFPDQDYGQNRQKVKEFMKYQRDGPDKGMWKLKDGEPLLDNESAKKLIAPEQVCEVEAMGQGLQFWEDSENFNYNEDELQLEESLLPWNTSRNFINATQMRSMVQLHGVGDPTGCGEGFSFLKASMKGGFVKSAASKAASKKSGSSSGHGSAVSQQQRAYDEEISKTWYTNAKSLSVSNPFDEIDNPDETNDSNRNVYPHREDKKVLRITRKRRDQNGIIQRQTIVVRDPRVIKGYLKGKDIRQKAKLDVNLLLADNNAEIKNVEEIEMQKKLLQTELASLEKSQQRRAARQNTKKKVVIGEDGKVVKNTNRRCATCGQLGHIRTNKSCPMYHLRDTNGKGSRQGTASATSPSTPMNASASPGTPM
ncbi:histone acetyltransferase [Maudiozyma humilis]|uniref:Histone acetyltransferase n=1 Tax=Maudiozyma humilis TaxID=51915 RepID=A0AAV5S3Y8_MAUHU|nr:histone acetyltransferase [Kazachstania humilis]